MSTDKSTDRAPGLIYTPLPSDEIDAAFSIESSSYPSDEAATLSGLRYRQANASPYFRGAYKNSALIGFVCATRCAAFEEESMSTHDPEGSILAIHSVVVKEDCRRKGHATAMLKNYVDSVDDSDGIESLRLIAKQHLLAFYVSCGFRVNGLSPIIHGADRWFDLSLDLVDFKKPRFKIIDAFASEAGAGNPAAVVFGFDVEKVTEVWMQKVAAEFNLSETVFVHPEGADGARRLRFFTPTTEISLCGHATLSSAYVFLNGEGGDEGGRENLTFLTREDIELRTSRTENGMVKMNFPLNIADKIEEKELPKFEVLVEEGFGIDKGGVVCISGTKDGDGRWFNVLAEVTPEAFDALKIDISALTTSPIYTHGIIVCKVGSRVEGCDFTSRYFAPKIGIDEDPVTGSAHCTSAPYFAEKLDKPVVRGLQDSKRGGVMTCTVDFGAGRIDLEGDALCVSEGKINF
ncbi:hypothetical protein TrVE_jg2696 [Triparma verrucosa]|uniref:N-acetyltransferase domain-containing protein n=1 Tax=Triparma verrucosa TaxID=1606542 RepID=A0A9W7BGI5_9STRA|nr:hypothetical protein TrVE_jg2696 [Triparma verrucosa]